MGLTLATRKAHPVRTHWSGRAVQFRLVHSDIVCHATGTLVKSYTSSYFSQPQVIGYHV